MKLGIDHGYYAVKTRHFSFPAGIAEYSHEPYTQQNVLEYGGKFYVCGTGRQPILRNKMDNDNYYLLTLAAVAMEIKHRAENPECSVTLGAGLPLAGFGREKKSFREYLLRSSQPVCFKYEGISYTITIQDVKLFPQGYSAIAIHPEFIQNEPSVLLMDIGGWTVDLMRLDNGIPNAATCRSLELGMIRCTDEVREQVRRDTGLSITDAQVERVLAGQPCSINDEARSIIQKQGRIYTEHLLSAVMEAGFDLKAIKAAAYAVSRNMRRSLRELEQTVMEDRFSMESGKVAAKEPKAKASKPKAEKAEKEEKTPDRWATAHPVKPFRALEQHECYMEIENKIFNICEFSRKMEKVGHTYTPANPEPPSGEDKPEKPKNRDQER